MQDYRKLFVRQKAHKLALDVYADSAKYLAHRPAWELRGQVHGAAISVPSDIAEGSGRGSNSDFRTLWDRSTNLSMICSSPRTSGSCL
jgi:four helix bundle protein